MEKEESKKEQILDAAMQCFSRFGIQKATMDDIAHVLGMKKASLYYYYKNKEAIFIDAIERELTIAYSIANEKIKSAKSCSEKLRVHIIEIITYFNHRKAMLDLNIDVMMENNPLMQTIHTCFASKGIDFMKSVIAEGIARKEFVEGDPAQLAELVHSFINARKRCFINNTIYSGTQEVNLKSFEEELLTVLDLILNGLKIRK